MENDGCGSIASKDAVEEDIKGYFSGTCRQLIEDIDRGWRYFWKKRGVDPPPDCYSEADRWFGKTSKLSYSEKVSLTQNKQKEAERTAGIQKADREFLGE